MERVVFRLAFRLAIAGWLLATAFVVAILARGNTVAPGVCAVLAAVAGMMFFATVVEIAVARVKRRLEAEGSHGD